MHPRVHSECPFGSLGHASPGMHDSFAEIEAVLTILDELPPGIVRETTVVAQLPVCELELPRRCSTSRECYYGVPSSLGDANVRTGLYGIEAAEAHIREARP